MIVMAELDGLAAPAPGLPARVRADAMSRGGPARVVTWDDPLPGASLSTQLSGLDYLQAIVDGRSPAPR